MQKNEKNAKNADTDTKLSITDYRARHIPTNIGEENTFYVILVHVTLVVQVNSQSASL